MKLQLRNRIQIGQETEEIVEAYPCQLTQKGAYWYVTYKNAEDETVLIKCNASEMIMTRYTSPKTVMRFGKNQTWPYTIATPLGLQTFETVTHTYQWLAETNCLSICYDLKQAASDTLFASYHLQLLLVDD
ncbi:DUF1934 domain-containing protein [Streptococcus halichoeri]|uniref:DUF1934 domain-containing protein n=1 Tax=Streptococcus halichoeri TaxID=254785 RepID=UPI00135A67C5|nr:DUF1934 domain-containing protein [Streptococcus halichoeri]